MGSTVSICKVRREAVAALPGGAAGTSPEAFALPLPIARWVRRRVGPYVQGAPRLTPTGRHRLLRLSSGEGELYLKLHRDVASWHAEVFAYTHWCGGVRGWVPEVLGVFQAANARGLLTRALPGQPLERTALAGTAKDEVWRRAGELAAAVDRQATGPWFGVPDRRGKPQGECHSYPVDYARHEFDHLLRFALQRHYLEASEQQVVTWAMEQCECFAGERPCPVNRDYTPGNWLVDEKGELSGIVDFEDMRWGLRVETFAHLWTKYACGQPSAEGAFFRGYGVPFWLNQATQAQVACTRLALATVVKGAEQQSPVHLARGRNIFRWLRSIRGSNLTKAFESECALD